MTIQLTPIFEQGDNSALIAALESYPVEAIRRAALFLPHVVQIDLDYESLPHDDFNKAWAVQLERHRAGTFRLPCAQLLVRSFLRSNGAELLTLAVRCIPIDPFPEGSFVFMVIIKRRDGSYQPIDYSACVIPGREPVEIECLYPAELYRDAEKIEIDTIETGHMHLNVATYYHALKMVPPVSDTLN